MTRPPIRSIRIEGSVTELPELLRQGCIEDSIPFVEAHIRQSLVEMYARSHGIVIDEEEWKAEVSSLRKELNLYGAADTKDWLTARRLTTEDLIRWAKRRVAKRKAMLHIADDDALERAFPLHRLALDRALLSHIVAETREQAEELLFRLEDGDDFHRLARDCTLDAATRYSGGYAGAAGRGDLTPEEVAAVFGATEGAAVGPFRTAEGRWRIARVEELRPADLRDEETRDALRQRLFEEWLASAIASSDIEVSLW